MVQLLFKVGSVRLCKRFSLIFKKIPLLEDPWLQFKSICCSPLLETSTKMSILFAKTLQPKRMIPLLLKFNSFKRFKRDKSGLKNLNQLSFNAIFFRLSADINTPASSDLIELCDKSSSLRLLTPLSKVFESILRMRLCEKYACSINGLCANKNAGNWVRLFDVMLSSLRFLHLWKSPLSNNLRDCLFMEIFASFGNLSKNFFGTFGISHMENLIETADWYVSSGGFTKLSSSSISLCPRPVSSDDKSQLQNTVASPVDALYVRFTQFELSLGTDRNNLAKITK